MLNIIGQYMLEDKDMWLCMDYESLATISKQIQNEFKALNATKESVDKLLKKVREEQQSVGRSAK